MNIYVGNLALEVTPDELRQRFTIFGEVLSVAVMNDKYIGSGQSRAYGFVEMSSRSAAEAAIAGLNGKVFLGRVIDVLQALPLSNHMDPIFSPRKPRRFSGRSRHRIF